MFSTNTLADPSIVTRLTCHQNGWDTVGLNQLFGPLEEKGIVHIICRLDAKSGSLKELI